MPRGLGTGLRRRTAPALALSLVLLTGSVALGLVLLSLAFVGPQTPWGYIGLIPLLTGIVGFCPLYRLLGINTCPAGR